MPHSGFFETAQLRRICVIPRGFKGAAMAAGGVRYWIWNKRTLAIRNLTGSEGNRIL
jgi:hypothetical protein